MITNPATILAPVTLPRPGYLGTFYEPNYANQKVTRITGEPGAAFNYQGGGTDTWSSCPTENYSMLHNLWNSDQSLIAIENYNLGSGYTAGSTPKVFLDGTTYAPLFGQPSNWPISDSDWRWHPGKAHPHEMFIIGSGNPGGATLYLFDVVNNVVTANWNAFVSCGFYATYFGVHTKGNPSADGKFILLSDGLNMVVLNTTTGQFGAVFNLQTEGVQWPADDCGISPSGKYAYVHYSAGNEPIRIFDVDPVTLNLSVHHYASNPPSGSSGTGANGYIAGLGHLDLFYNAFDNNDEYVAGQWASGSTGQAVPGVACVPSAGGLVGHVGAVRLRDGAMRSYTDPTNEEQAQHITCRNLDRPGWIYVSYHGYAADAGAKRFWDEIIAIPADLSGRCERYAISRSDHYNQGSNPVGNGNWLYRSEPHAQPSRDGLRIMYESNWQARGTGGGPSIQAYVIDNTPSVQGNTAEEEGLLSWVVRRW